LHRANRYASVSVVIRLPFHGNIQRNSDLNVRERLWLIMRALTTKRVPSQSSLWGGGMNGRHRVGLDLLTSVFARIARFVSTPRPVGIGAAIGTM
jgi:hypothetical protein